jgi:hypothetical protein
MMLEFPLLDVKIFFMIYIVNVILNLIQTRNSLLLV